MFFLEDSDEEYANLANHEQVLSVRADLQRIARRNLATAVLFAHRRAIRHALAALRAYASRHLIVTNNKDRMYEVVKTPIWRQGQFFQQQRHRKMSAALLALQQNTGRHKATIAHQHHIGRTRAVVFGALVMHMREQRALDIQDQRRAEIFSATYVPAALIRSWRRRAYARWHSRSCLPLADVFNVLMLLRLGVNALRVHARRANYMRSLQSRSDTHKFSHHTNDKRYVLSVLQKRFSTRASLARKMLLRRGCTEAARLAVQMLYINLPTNGDVHQMERARRMLEIKSARRRHFLRYGLRSLFALFSRRRAAAQLLRKFLRHSVGLSGMQSTTLARNAHQDCLLKKQTLRRLRWNMEERQVSRTALAMAARLRQHRARAHVLTQLIAIRLQRVRSRRASLGWDSHAAEVARQRVFTMWLRRLNASLVQTSSMSVATEYATPYTRHNFSLLAQRVSFRKKNRALISWMAIALRNRRVEGRRLRVAQAGYESYMCRKAFLSLRRRCQALRARKKAHLLAGFALSARNTAQAIIAMKYQANLLPTRKNFSSKRLLKIRRNNSLLFWKLWRIARGLQSWKIYLNARRRRRYEWGICQEAHHTDFCALGVRLWIAAAGERSAQLHDAHSRSVLCDAWSRWKRAVEQGRIRRGSNPSIVSSIVGDRSYARLSPVGVPTTLNSASLRAADVASKYIALLSQSSVTSDRASLEVQSAALSSSVPIRHETLRSLAAAAPSTPPPLHRAPPRTYTYDQEVYGNKTLSSPVSIANATMSSPEPKQVDKSLSLYTDTARTDTLKKNQRIAIAHELISLVATLKEKLIV